MEFSPQISQMTAGEFCYDYNGGTFRSSLFPESYSKSAKNQQENN